MSKKGADDDEGCQTGVGRRRAGAGGGPGRAEGGQEQGRIRAGEG